MKILFSNTLPFFLAHGGTQTLLEALMSQLSNLGAEVEPVRWWDENQTGDIMHYMNRPPSWLHLRLAREKGFKLVMTQNLDATASRSRAHLLLQSLATRVGRRVVPGMAARMGWDVYQDLDAMIYVVQHEWETAQLLFEAPSGRGHIIPHGLDEDAIEALAAPQPEEDYLVYVATITERKNPVLLAQAALNAKVPVVFLGKPFSETDPYFRQFQSLVDNRYVRYAGFVTVEEKYRWLRGARGFALLSQFESGCIAVYEGAAAGLPLFLPDLPWASRVYGHVPHAQFTPLHSVKTVTRQLADFYSKAHRQKTMTFPILSWKEVARQYLAIYEQLLSDKK